MANVVSIQNSIIGKSIVSFTNEQTGRPVDGTSIFYCTKISKDHGSGYRCEKSFVRSNVIPYDQIIIGKECEILYDRFGKVQNIRYSETAE